VCTFISGDKTKKDNIYIYLCHKLKHENKSVTDSTLKIKDKISFDQRPEKTNTIKEFIHFEMNIIIGKNNTLHNKPKPSRKLINLALL